jgi:hypothetical protein
MRFDSGARLSPFEIRSYQSRRFAPPTTLLLVHGATSLAWLLLYVTQALAETLAA